MSEGTREPIRVDHAPSRCPYCHDGFESVHEVVACAACGARHHAECQAQARKCATCGASEFLFPRGGGSAPAVGGPATKAADPFDEYRSLPAPARTGRPGSGPDLGDVALFVGLLISLIIAAGVIDAVFLPEGAAHADTVGKVLGALAVTLPAIAVAVRRWRRERRRRRDTPYPPEGSG